MSKLIDKNRYCDDSIAEFNKFLCHSVAELITKSGSSHRKMALSAVQMGLRETKLSHMTQHSTYYKSTNVDEQGKPIRCLKHVEIMLICEILNVSYIDFMAEIHSKFKEVFL